MEKTPKIYVFSMNDNPDYLCIGYTEQEDVNTRIRQEVANKAMPNGYSPYTLRQVFKAVDNEGKPFMDHAVHKMLTEMGIPCERTDSYTKTEFFKTDLDTIEKVIFAIQNHTKVSRAIKGFKMRPEQERAVKEASRYFKTSPENEKRFLFNCKMRFGKCFTTYQLAKEMGWKRILILTFKPAVRNSWKEDLETHKDFVEWQFVTTEGKEGNDYRDCNQNNPIVAFGSFQDFLGKQDGGIKEHNLWAYDVDWDCIAFDEYHFGAWREMPQDLVEHDDTFSQFEDTFDEGKLRLKCSNYLYLSGTPFRSLQEGEFRDDQIFNWSYSDEQSAKANWNGPEDENPYAELPQMVLLTYKLPDSIVDVIEKTDINEFSLNEFFRADQEGNTYKFVHETEVNSFLKFICKDDISEFVETEYFDKNDDPTASDSKIRKSQVFMPFDSSKDKGKNPFGIELPNGMQHSIWFLNSVASCKAMEALLKDSPLFKGYRIALCAGDSCGTGTAAEDVVRSRMTNEPWNTRTITITCGKLLTGTTVEPWNSILMLRNCSSPETYFQAAFRVQTPWVRRNTDGTKEILKHNCFILDFAPNRALNQIYKYCEEQNIASDKSPEELVAEFTRFLPVLAYDGITMEKVDPSGLLDYAMGMTSAKSIARIWNSSKLIGLNEDVFDKVLDDEKALNILRNVEQWRGIKKGDTSSFEIVINLEKRLSDTKTRYEELDKKAEAGTLDADETEEYEEVKKELSKEEKELVEQKKELRKQKKMIREKLLSFLSSIPRFIYLADDNRSETLQRLIYPLEPELFAKVTGITHEDFEYLRSLKVFNEGRLNHAVFAFRKNERVSLEYTGISKHTSDIVGGYNTTMTEYELQNTDFDTDFTEVIDEDGIEKVAQESVKANEVSKEPAAVENEETTEKVEEPTTKAEDVITEVKESKAEDETPTPANSVTEPVSIEEEPSSVNNEVVSSRSEKLPDKGNSIRNEVKSKKKEKGFFGRLLDVLNRK